MLWMTARSKAESLLAISLPGPKHSGFPLLSSEEKPWSAVSGLVRSDWLIWNSSYGPVNHQKLGDLGLCSSHRKPLVLMPHCCWWREVDHAPSNQVVERRKEGIIVNVRDHWQMGSKQRGLCSEEVMGFSGR